MKKFLLFSFLLVAFFAQSQQDNAYMPQPKYPQLFKTIIPIEKNAPDWILKMYSSTPNLFEIKNAYESYYSQNEFVKTTHTQNYKHFVRQVVENNWYDENGNIQISQQSNADLSKVIEKNSATSASWTPIGPLNTYNNGGTKTVSEQANIYTIAQSISNPMIMLCGGETGAVYKTTDKGENWFPVGDNFFNDGVVSVEIDPTNPDIMFVGSSNCIYRSTNGGTSWSQVLNVSGLSIYEFAINPSNNQLIFAAGYTGLYKSTDGGATWTRVFSVTCWDVKYKTNDPQTIFLLKSNTALKLIEFYKSTDGGTTFTNKKTGWFVPTATSTIEGARMGVTNADANRIYVVMLGNVDNYTTDVDYNGIYKSTDAGESWSMPYDQNNDGTPDNNPGGPYSADHWCLSSFGYTGGDYDQGFYNLAIDVSDTDPDKFLVGMLNLFKSEDGGKTYTPWGGYACSNCSDYYRHPDQQDILINGNDVFVASDGGVDLYDANLNIVRAINKGINGSDNWGFGQGWNEDVLTAGRYHNGNAVYHTNYQNGKFISLGGGESSTGYVNLSNNLEIYHSDIDARKITSDFNTPNVPISNIAMFPNESYFTSDKSYIVYDPRYNNNLYLGNENKLWKSEDGGASFTLLKAFGTTTTNKVTGIEVSRVDPKIIFVAQRNGSSPKLWRTQDGGVTWTSITLPSTQVTMFISLNENNVIFIGFGGGTNVVYKSTNLGNSWTNLTTSTISSAPISGIVAQLGTSDGVYIVRSGTNKIYYRNSTLTDWQLYNQGLPVNTRIMGILPFYKTNALRISGTRGFWETPLYEKSNPIAQPMVDKKVVDCNRTQVYFDDYSALNHTGATWLWNFPGASTVSSNTVRNPIVTYNVPGQYDVTLTVTDGNGLTSSKTIQKMIEVQPSVCGIEKQPINVLEMTTQTQSAVSGDLNYGDTKNLTFTGWIKPNGTQVDWAGIVCFGSLTKNLLGFSTANQLQFHLNGSYYSVTTGLYAVADQWNFVAFRLTPSQITIFLNDKKFSLSGTFTSLNLNKIILGKDYNIDERTYKGQMEEFCVWNRALTDNEIYLGRHLIKTSNSDPNLVAYYQFNNTQNIGLVYDKINANDLAVSSDITFPASTAPVGEGVSQLQTISAIGTFSFADVQADLNFPSPTIPYGKVVVSKLSLAPYNIPTTNSVANEYWILDNYGLVTSFTGLASVSLTSSSDLSGLNTDNLNIFKRGNNDYLQTAWTQGANASSISSKTVQFAGTGLTQSNQWFIGSNVVSGVEVVQPQANFVVYPNPYIQGQELTVKGIDGNYKFNLYTSDGKLIFSKHLQTNTFKIEKSLTKGIYFYRIENDNKLYFGKLSVD